MSLSQRNQSSGKYKIDKKEQVKMFDYVNSHLTLMENNYDNHKSLFVVKENKDKVVIPEPRYQSINKSRMDRPSDDKKSKSTSKSKSTFEPYVYSSYHDFDCTICMEDIKVGESVQKLKCNHLFHADCLLWYHSDPDSTSSLTCPTCEDDLME